MGSFHELILQGREPGENGLPEDYFDSLQAEYDTLSEGSASKVSELMAQQKERDAEIKRLKAANYDLLMTSSSGDGTGNQDDQQGNDEFPAHQGIDSLFG